MYLANSLGDMEKHRALKIHIAFSASVCLYANLARLYSLEKLNMSC